MSTPTHIVVGAVVAKFALQHGLIVNPNHLYLISILAANGPDMDVVVIRYPKDHRSFPTHYPFNWLILFTIIAGILNLTNNVSLFPYFWLVVFNVFLHFFLDTWNIRTGILWLMPFNRKDVNFFKSLPHEITVWGNIRQYATHTLTKIELVIVGLGLFYLFLH